MPRPTVLERIASWASALEYDQIPESVLARARYQTINVLASQYASVTAGAGSSMARVVARWNKPGPCTVLPTGEKTAVHEAVLVNAARSMALDYDDYLYMGHTGHSAVCGAWAVGEQTGAAAREVLVAQVIANEIGGRLGASCVLGPQNGQAWSFIHAAEGAAIAARLYGLDAQQTMHALAIALYQPPFTLWPGFLGPTSKELTAALPTVQGIMAADLAREGMTGAPDLLEQPRRGFWSYFAHVPLPAMMTGLGDRWLTETLAYKPYPGCAYIDTTLDALFDLLEQHQQRTGSPLRPSQVARVDVEASVLTVEMDNLSRQYGDPADDLNPVAINFSIPLNVAIAIVAGRHGGAQMARSFLDDNAKQLRALAAKVRLRHDWPMTFEVVRSFEGIAGGGVLRGAFGGRQLRRLAGGLHDLLGGTKATDLEIGALLRNHPAALWRAAKLVGAGTRTRASSDLAEADLSSFRMTFPAQVTLETTDGRTRSARVDVPRGAPGGGDYDSVVETKLRAESAGHITPQACERLLEACRGFEQSNLAQLSDLACGAPG